jgi:hypothetical protein
MIYLIITTSIHNRYGSIQAEKRKEEYLRSITETLQHLPNEIQPFIVENNGERETYLDHFTHNSKKVPVIYTINNTYSFKNKGVNELLDIQDVIRLKKIDPTDIIIKLTGRYRVTTPDFFKEVIGFQKEYDAFIKFYGSCSLQYETYDCILGCYAIRSMYLSMFHYHQMNQYDSPEIAFATYVRRMIPKIKEVKNLCLECKFSEDGRILHV